MGASRCSSSRRRSITVCVTAMILLASVASSAAVVKSGHPTHPTIRLKSGHTIHTHSTPGRGQRRSLAEAPNAAVAAAASSLHWGRLGDGVGTQHLQQQHQLLVSVRLDASHEETQALLHNLELLGAHISGYLPDSTYLVLGSDLAAAVAANSSAVAWVGDHLPQYKVSPDLRSVARALERMLSSAAHAAALLAQNATEGAAQALRQAAEGADEAAALARVKWDASSGALSVPIVVTFPPTAPHEADCGPANSSATSSSAAGADPGMGAAADWPAHLAYALSLAAPSSSSFSADSSPVSVQRLASHKALVTVPASRLLAAVDWLAAQRQVHWLSAAAPHKFHNHAAAAVLQAAKAPGDDSRPDDAGVYPLWNAGLTGKGEIVGLGDSGIALDSCYFHDPEVEIKGNWRPLKRYPNIPVFQNPKHRKIAQYIAAADNGDAIGHGTHCAGSIAGKPLSDDGEAVLYQGMAPDAKIAFMDLSSGRSGEVGTPPSLNEYYFPFAYELGARVHSNSWGSNSLDYDVSAAEVDDFTWKNKDFLPVFAAGNFGDMDTGAGSGSGTRTITSPATCKNCLAVGATPNAGIEERSSAQARDGGLGGVFGGIFGANGASRGSQYDVVIGNFDVGGTPHTWKVVMASFGAPVASIFGEEYPVRAAEPALACEELSNAGDLEGAVALVERGTCMFVEKALNAQKAGAVAVIVYDNELGAYFMAEAPNEGTTSQVKVPVGMLPRRFGEEMLVTLGGDGMNGGAVTVKFEELQQNGAQYDDLSEFSSQGPTLDGRAKPDVLAPGTTISAAPPGLRGAVGEFGDSCTVSLQSGTSMATPLVAGSAALVREYFTAGYYPGGEKGKGKKFNPSGALVKAAMLGGARSINGFEADTGLPVDPAPASTRQGWGRLYLARSVPLKDGPEEGWRMQVVDGAELGAKGQQHEYCLRAAGGPLRVTLVWWDYPGMPSSDAAIVNDLDLEVTAPGGRSVLLGNGGALPDRVNTVEQVVASDMPAGPLSIRVKAASLFARAGVQPYALVVHGKFEGDLVSDANPALDGRKAAGKAAECPK